MTGCLICEAPPDPALGYSMGMMGWVCSGTCRDKYNSLLKTIFKEENKMGQTAIDKAVVLLMDKANEHRTEAGELENKSKICIFRAIELEALAQEIQKLVS